MPDTGALAGCLGALGLMIVVPIALLALNFALLIWVARDAKARGMDSALLWMVLVMLTGPVGLIIYVFSRPQGEITLCENCGNKRLSVSAKCPTCGNR